MPELLRAMDLFVLPSRAEGISNTILESMATSLPVLATRVGGNEELVEEGITGTLVPPGNPTTMSEAILRYARDVNTRVSQGEAARRRIEKEFTIDKMQEKYMSLYDQLLNGNTKCAE